MNRKEAITKAVDWWSNKVCNQVHHNNGDTSGVSAIAMLFADMLYTPVSKTAAENFKAELARQINVDLDNGWHCICLDVDYRPCEILSAAAKFADINEMNFPFKTGMRIWVYSDNYIVEVSDGDGKPYESL